MTPPTAEKIMLYVQRDADGVLLLATTNPQDCSIHFPISSQFVWIEKP